MHHSLRLVSHIPFQVTDFSEMFYSTHTFTGTSGGAGGIAAWDTSKASTMMGMFRESLAFNAPIQQWNVEQVTTFKLTFNGATKFDQPVGQWNIVSVKEADALNDVFQPETNPATTGLSSCNKRLIADAWANNDVFKETNTSGWDSTNTGTSPSWEKIYPDAWAADSCPPLTDPNFKQATWDWVNLDARAASAKWGVIGKWDTSAVKTFDNAFSQFRDESGNEPNSNVASNSKAASFNANLPWITTSVKSMVKMFKSATAFNGDVTSFDTAQVTKMTATFQGCENFNGDVSKWSTEKVTDFQK